MLQAVGTGIYHAEATRQQYAEAQFERQWPDLIREGLRLVTGLAVAAWAKAIANRFAVRIE